MSWEEIQKTYPNEWVAVIDYKREGPVEVSGVVIGHAPERDEFYASTDIQKYDRVALRYTGELIQESDLPLLWQISHTA
ncbi:MAG: hypothetical protein A3H42_03035 [Deltaproteobacteria bacterium RIFCSPLOWO2_02_FULL_46_8]|nr:MAG: hypothetical protein A3H42_03035 [Deltaproteobacteria bacterium RIFCSPLOWO2_02_FULL_46_8]